MAYDVVGLFSISNCAFFNKLFVHIVVHYSVCHASSNFVFRNNRLTMDETIYNVGMLLISDCSGVQVSITDSMFEKTALDIYVNNFTEIRINNSTFTGASSRWDFCDTEKIECNNHLQQTFSSTGGSTVYFDKGPAYGCRIV